MGHDEDHRDREGTLHETSVPGFDGSYLRVPLCGDAREACFQRGDVTPQLRALVLGEERELLGLLTLFQFASDRSLQLVEHRADVFDFLALAVLEGVGQMAQAFLGAGVDGPEDGLAVAVEAGAERVEGGAAVIGLPSSSHC